METIPSPYFLSPTLSMMPVEPQPNRLQLLRWVPGWGEPPSLTRHQQNTLLLIALAMAIVSYGGVLLALALPQIQASFAIPAEELSYWLALIRFGAVPAFGLALAADRFGRRRLLIGALLGFALFGIGCTFAQTLAWFVSAQFALRTCIATVGLLATVIIVEEFPASARGWGIGAFTALGSAGGGCAALAFALIDHVPYGWRALMLVCGLALGLVVVMNRHIAETSAFVQRQSAYLAAASLLHRSPWWWRYARRLSLLMVIVVLYNIGGDAALFYDPTYLQQQHHWQPWQISVLNLCAGFMAVIGSGASGRWSDRYGRRLTSGLFLMAAAVAIWCYFQAAGWWLPVWWAVLLFTTIGASVTLNAFSAELFPTAVRSSASGIIALVATISGSFSLIVHGWLWPQVGSPWLGVSWLALLLLPAAVLFVCLPETSGQPLEEL